MARRPAKKPPNVGFHLSSTCLKYCIDDLEELKRKLHMAMLPPNNVVLSLACCNPIRILLPLGAYKNPEVKYIMLPAIHPILKAPPHCSTVSLIRGEAGNSIYEFN